MKKLPKRISVSLSSVLLYLQDIELIEEVFKNNCKSYKIVTEEYEVDSIEELKQLGTLEFEKIGFQSQEPQVSLDILFSSTRIFCYEDNVVSTGIVSKLVEILEPRSVPSTYIIRSNLDIIVSIVAIFLLFQPVIKLDDFIKSIIVYIQFGFLVPRIYNFIFQRNRNIDKRIVFHAKNKSPKVSFFLEYKNQIILLIIGGFITFVVQILIQWIKEKILAH
ncbi:hypothetical protein [Nostoc sp. 'Peltigera malacea cyanobiont' DB3992]|uniref:hypothetical protein n=1 Tax=Nostoc sp. 'Peltigera malacea cyanobiont' DB3992 TaxID=1206980 RepID=UPI000C03F2F5|nr:hypothetical protein [Nostoc sp. 'Peltigera malacea cyanobiont' DB3992]PHM09460.1 hypothetical protein CK516_14460 [Nostoc sp. 'Peltigera malacea cyanobiont' DB3992]